ncbi:MAG: hypothetical protein KGQ87_11600, partial [Verrucomicrobia bacterium]|nr:hypothetical protein [Verrucomicrobiota bacterium]
MRSCPTRQTTRQGELPYASIRHMVVFFSQHAAIFLLPLDAISPGPVAWRQQGSGIRPLPLTHQQLLLIVDLQEIRRIVELMNEHGLTQFDLTK